MNNYMKHSIAYILCAMAFTSCNAAPIQTSSPFTDIEKQLKQEVASQGFLPLSSFIPFFDMAKIPPAMKNLINKIQISNPSFKVTTSSFALTGMAKLNNLVLSLDVLFDRAGVTPQGHLSIQLPVGAKVSDLIPELKKLDIIEFKLIRFIVSNHDYTDSLTQSPVKPGLNFAAGIEFDTLLETIRTKIDSKLSKNDFKKALSKFFVTETIGIRIAAFIPVDFGDITIYAEMPVEFGIDLAALKKKDGQAVFKKPFITKITTSSFKAAISLAQLEPEITISGGIFVYFQTQKKPLEFRALGTVTQSGIELGGEVVGAYDPAFGLNFLAFGSIDPKTPPMIFSLYFDYALSSATIAVCGLPLPTGITLSGTMSLGKQQYRTTGSGLISVKLESASISEFVASGKINQIDISRFIEILSDMGKKKLNIGDEIPLIKFSDLELVISPFPTTVFDVSYDAGVKAGAKIQFGKFTAQGSLMIGLTTEEPRFMVQASVNPIEIKTRKGKVILALTGFGADNKIGTADDMAMLAIDLAANRPLNEQKMELDAALLIPPLEFWGGMKFSFDGSSISGLGEGNFFDGKFSAKTEISLDFDDPEDFSFSCLMHNDFTQWFSEKLKEGFVEFKKQAEADIKKYDKQMEAARKNFEGKADVELKRVDARIAEINTELKKLRLPADGKLKAAAGNNIHIFNHTQNPQYVSFYKVNKKSKEAEKIGSTILIKPYTKNQIKRPALLKVAKYDRDIFISEQSADLPQKLTKTDYTSKARKHVGGSIVRVHITKQNNAYKFYSGAEWDRGPGAKIVALGSELASFKTYREALLKPGTKTVDAWIETIKQLKAIPEAFVALSDKVISAMTKALNIIVIHDAKLETAGQDLQEGKLPAVSLNFDINTPKGKSYTFDIDDLQLDLKKPLQFFTDVAKIITTQLVQIKGDKGQVQKDIIEDF